MPTKPEIPALAQPFRALRPFAVALILAFASDAAHALTSTWGGGTGVWNDPTRWDTNPNYPCNGQGGFDYDVVFGSGTVTLNLDCTVDDFTQSGGTVDGGFDLTIDDVFGWTGGTLAGAGTTRVGGGLAASGTSLKSLADTRTLVIENGISSWSAGNIYLSSGAATLRNESTWNVTGGNRSLYDQSDLGSFENAATGIVNVDLDNATRVLTVSPGNVSNAGVLDIQQGIVRFTVDFVQTAGATRLDGGRLESTPLLDIQGGSLEGSGDVEADVAIAGRSRRASRPDRSISRAISPSRPVATLRSSCWDPLAVASTTPSL